MSLDLQRKYAMRFAQNAAYRRAKDQSSGSRD
jgi:hypothetical protein